jgi:hypothetical protein
MSRTAALAAFILLAGCSKADNASSPGGVTVGEARALDEAAEMIEAQRLPPEANPPLSQSSPATTPAASDAAPIPNKTGG